MRREHGVGDGRFDAAEAGGEIPQFEGIDKTLGRSTSATDVSTNRLSAGLHGNAALVSKLVTNAGVTYSITHFLGVAGLGRRDDLFQFDASIGLALTTHVRLSLSYVYMINWSTLAAADFTRESVTLTAVATY